MTSLDYFSIPMWLRDSKLTQVMFSEALINRDIDQLLQPFDAEYFKETSDVNSFEDFVLVLEAARYFDVSYPISLFWYARNNKEKVLNHLKEFEFSKELLEEVSDDLWFLDTDKKSQMLNFLRSINVDKMLIKELESTLDYTFKRADGRSVDFFLAGIQIGSFNFDSFEYGVLYNAIRDNENIFEEISYSIVSYSDGIIDIKTSVSISDYDTDVETDSCSTCLLVTQFNKQLFLDFFKEI